MFILWRKTCAINTALTSRQQQEQGAIGCSLDGGIWLGRGVEMGFSSFPRTTSCTLQQLRGNSGLGGAKPPFSNPGHLNFQHWKYLQVICRKQSQVHAYDNFLAGVSPVHMAVIPLVKVGKYFIIYIFLLGHSDE